MDKLKRDKSFAAGLVFGLAVGTLLSVSSVTTAREQHEKLYPTNYAVVAAKDLEAGTTLTPEMLERKVYSNHKLRCGISPQAISSVLGRKTLVPLKKGQVVTGFEMEPNEAHEKGHHENL